MSRLFLVLAIAAAMTKGGASQAQTVRLDPGLSITVINTLADVCFQTARGITLTPEIAANLLLNPLSARPAVLGGRFAGYPTWFEVMQGPGQVFVAVGDRSGACHIIIANTTQTSEIQRQVVTALSMTGFQAIRTPPAASPSVNDQMLARPGPDGYMVVNVYGPRQTVGDGSGEQAVIHVNLVPKEFFEAIAERR